MKLVFKRLGAYIIDILIVSIISAVISNIGTINYQMEKYMDTYEQVLEISEQYQNEELSKEEFTKKMQKLNYTLEKNSTITSIISIACLIGYFGIFQYSQNGKTVGKRIFKLQVVKSKEGNLNLINYLIRSIFLNSIVFTLIKLILLYTLSKNTYMNIYNYISNGQAIFQLLIIVSAFISKEGRGIHDFIAGTKVIDLKEIDEFQKGVKKKVIEGEIIK